jgi:polar amino acid transport system substrate-binding protein
MKGFTIQPQTVAVGHYVGVLSRANAPLRDAIDNILRGAMRDGTLERIFRKWRVWNDDQPKLYARLLAGEPVPPITGLDTSAASRRCRSGKRRSAICRRCCARRSSRSCCRACRWARHRWAC